MLRVLVQAEPFDVGGEYERLLNGCAGAGALANFVGVVRSNEQRPITALTLEHYPGMTQAALERIAQDAVTRFGLLGCSVIHRFGTLAPGEGIVLVVTAASHRQAALDGTAFLIDWLKTDAPFWKKEHLANGEDVWVEARAADDKAAGKWKEGPFSECLPKIRPAAI